MESLQMFLDARLLALLVVAVAISYLVGVITGEHPPARLADTDTTRRPDEARRTRDGRHGFGARAHTNEGGLTLVPARRPRRLEPPVRIGPRRRAGGVRHLPERRRDRPALRLPDHELDGRELGRGPGPHRVRPARDAEDEARPRGRPEPPGVARRRP